MCGAVDGPEARWRDAAGRVLSECRAPVGVGSHGVVANMWPAAGVSVSVLTQRPCPRPSPLPHLPLRVKIWPWGCVSVAPSVRLGDVPCEQQVLGPAFAGQSSGADEP